MEVVDARGLDSLTMRHLAAELGVGTMTLYGCFRTKEELLDGIADFVLSSLPVDVPDGGKPVDTVRQLAHSLHETMHQHPTVVRLFSSRLISSEGALVGGFEAPLASLRAAGVPQDVAVRLFGALLTYTLGFTMYQIPRPWGPDGPEAAEERRRRKAYYESLPLAEFPNLVELAEPLTTIASEEQFEWGLEAMIAGIPELKR